MKRTAFTLCLAAALLASPPRATRAQGALGQRVDELSRQIAAKMSAQQKTTVAVVEFTDLQGRVTDFGRFLAEELITRLHETEKFKVIERQLLNKIIAEQKLSLTGVIDPASAKQLGKLLGVEAIVTGTVTNLAQSLRVNARIVSTTTGEVIAAASTEIAKDDSVIGLLNNQPMSAPGAKPAPPPAVADDKAANKVIQNEFIVELNSCERSLSSVTCSLTLTNGAAKERPMFLSCGNSKLFDEAGNEYTAGLSVIGGKDSRTRVREYMCRGASNDLVPQVPTKAGLKFENVSQDAKRVTVLAYFGSEFKAIFRNVEIK